MTFTTEVTADTPKVWYDLRRISGASQPDSSGNSHTGTVTGSPRVAPVGAWMDNGAGGDSEYVKSTLKVANSGASVSAFAAEAVFDLYGQSVTLNTELVVLDTALNDFPFALFVPPAGPYPLFTWSGAHDWQLSGSPNFVTVNAGAHHLIFDFDGTTGRLYLDGTLIASDTTYGGNAYGPAVWPADAFMVVNDDLCGCNHGWTYLQRHAIYYEHSLGATRVGVHATAARQNDPPPIVWANTFAVEVIADSPDIWWDTRQISGSVQPDRSGNGKTGTVTGSPSVDTDLGATFDNSPTGDDQYITGNASVGPTTFAAFSIECVIKHDYTKQNGSAVYATILGWDDAGDLLPVSFTVQGSSSRYIQPVMRKVGGSYQGTSAQGPNTPYEFHHLVFEYDGTDAHLYIDGIETPATTFTPGAHLEFSTAEVFMLGNDQCACTDGAGGIIRHGIWYSHALGPARVLTHAWAALSNDPGVGGGGPPVPTCSTATPNTGYTTGGQSIVLAGTGLTGATEVDFGATPAAAFHVDSDLQITATTPPHAEGTVNVTVTTPGGISA